LKREREREREREILTGFTSETENKALHTHTQREKEREREAGLVSGREAGYVIVDLKYDARVKLGNLLSVHMGNLL